MSTCRAKHIRQSPGHRLRLIFLDPFALLSRPRTGQTLGCTHRCFPGIRATEVLLTFLFLAGCSFSVVAQIGSSRSESEQSPQGAVRATYEAYLRAWKDKDLNALDHIPAMTIKRSTSRESPVRSRTRSPQPRRTALITPDCRSHICRVVWRLCHCFRANRGELEGRAR